MVTWCMGHTRHVTPRDTSVAVPTAREVCACGSDPYLRSRASTGNAACEQRMHLIRITLVNSIHQLRFQAPKGKVRAGDGMQVPRRAADNHTPLFRPRNHDYRDPHCNSSGKQNR